MSLLAAPFIWKHCAPTGEKIKTIIEDVLNNFCHILSAVVCIVIPISSVHLIKGMLSASHKRKPTVRTPTVFYERSNINLVFDLFRLLWYLI